MKYIIGILLVTLFSCSTKSVETKENIDKTQWNTHHDTLDAGFILTFKYPNNIVLADVIDNCRCVGEKIKNEDKNQGTDSTNTRQWCICMQDTADYSIEYFISSWKSLYKGQVEEQRDTITIEDLKALRVTLKSKTKNASDRQLIYLKKYSTLFEIMNIYEATEKDFETFYKSIKIEEYRRK
jgi:hypothetical protein